MFAVLGIIALVAGVVITFAIDHQAGAVDLGVVGWVLLVGGGALLLVEMVSDTIRSATTRTHVRTERHMTDDGHHVVEDSRVA